jgi:hypothetical protein
MPDREDGSHASDGQQIDGPAVDREGIAGTGGGLATEIQKQTIMNIDPCPEESNQQSYQCPFESPMKQHPNRQPHEGKAGEYKEKAGQRPGSPRSVSA